MGVVAAAIAKALAVFRVAKGEGDVRPGPWALPVSGGWLPAGVGQFMNFWQLGYNPEKGSHSAIVEACVSAYSQTAAMLPGFHFRRLANGGRERVTSSALSRILRRPNGYQTPSDFMLNAVRSLYLEGNCYALALRNNRFEIDELHLMDPGQSGPAVMGPGEDVNGDAIEGGEIFYRLGGNAVIDARLAGLNDRRRIAEQLIVPQRDVLHIRLHSVRNAWPYPLVGESPLVAAYPDILSAERIRQQQDELYQNQARPSAVLSTDLNLSREQIAELRERWNEQAKGLHAGGVPILTQGLKVMPWTSAPPAKDMQIAELLKLASERIALVYRVPPAVLGLERPTAGTTDLYREWLSSGLGFCLEHFEQGFGRLFGLAGYPDDYIEFDTEALLRSARKDRIEMLVRGVQGGVFSPNEARAQEDLPAVAYGDEPRVQQQVVPLSAAAFIEPSPLGPAPAAPAAPAASGVPAAHGVPLGERPAPEKAMRGAIQAGANAAERAISHRAARLLGRDAA